MVRLVPGALGAAVVLATSLAGAGTPVSYPATLPLSRGLAQSAIGHARAWGTPLSAAQARWVRESSPRRAFRWGVWQEGGRPSTYPVRSTDGGIRWTAAGPQLATDWAGGSLYYVQKVYAISPQSVVMVSNAVIDVTTDGGRQWFQYLNPADDWSMVAYRARGGGIDLRVSPARFSRAGKPSAALYVLNVAHHRWRRLR